MVNVPSKLTRLVCCVIIVSWEWMNFSFGTYDDFLIPLLVLKGAEK